MHFLGFVQLGALAAVAAAQTNYVETFSSKASDAKPAPIPGVDRALKWSGIKPVTTDDLGGSGVKPDGTYYGAFDNSAPFTMSAKYSGSTVGHFTPSTYKMGCALYSNGAYKPTQDCSIFIQAYNESGLVGSDYQTYPVPRASCPTTNDCNLYNFGFYAPDYTNLQSLSFTLEPYDTSLGKITVYVDDMTYTVTSA